MPLAQVRTLGRRAGGLKPSNRRDADRHYQQEDGFGEDPGTEGSEASSKSLSRGSGRLAPGRRYGVFRIARFAAATSIGFLANEVVLVVGILAIYRVLALPSLIDPSFTLTVLGLNVLSLGIGDTVAFEINERVTVKVRREEGRSGRLRLFVRWAKYQTVAFTGNLVIAGVQLALLAGFSFHPAFGDIVGAIIAYPMTYVISMHFVWSVHPFRG